MSAMFTKKTRKRGGASLRCPVCGGVTKVMDTRRLAEEGVVRVRACTECSEGFSTIELVHVNRKREG
jgi:transcriptional regulator NrdR family protein